MSLNVAVQMDPIENINVKGDSTFAMMLEARERGPVMAGKVCLECGNATVIHKDGCDFCTACGAVGQCG